MALSSHCPTEPVRGLAVLSVRGAHGTWVCSQCKTPLRVGQSAAWEHVKPVVLDTSQELK